MKLHKLIQRASAAAVASAMILSVTLPTLAAAPDGTGNAAAADMLSLTNGTAALSEEDEGQDTGITVNGQSVLVNSTEVNNIRIQYTGGTDVSTLTILQAVAGDLTIKVNPTAAGEVDVVMKTESSAAVGGKLTVTGAHNVTITGETMAADRADIGDISGDLTLIATGEGGMAIRDRISVCVSSSSGEKAIYVGSNRETEQFESRIHPCVWRSWYPSEAYISVRKATTYPVTVHGGKLSNSENNTTFYKGETVRVKTSRPEKGLKFNRWLFPADVETIDDPTKTAFFFTMPDHAVEVTANWELYTGSEPTVFWEYYTHSGLLTPDNTPQNPAGMSNMTVSYDSASRTYTVDLKGDLEIPVDFKGNENPHIKVKGELGNSVHISGANNVSIDIDSQNKETDLNVDCAGTLRLKNNTGNSPLELKLTYKQAEGAGYTVVLDGKELEETPAYVSLNESLTIIPNISDPIPDDSSAGGDSSDAAGALVATAVAGAAVFGGYTIITELMLQDLLPEGAAIPKNQAQLAKLVWQTAGFPEPENASAFANVTDPETAKAAQWCVEQGYLDADFDPDRWTPKFKVIQTWNKAFPKQ
ncbi:InlB B-repeat-containing protein [Faecalibacterium taiwanense]|uniref:InlB B-repeat-containing protein n=1 Tax=Faecalibacterium taiwanense TaxID=3030638 RepID=UPI003AAE1960